MTGIVSKVACALVAVVVLSACTSGSGAVKAAASPTAASSKMPSVVGLSLDEAREVLATGGIDKIVVERKVSSMDPSEVLDQSPTSGSTLGGGQVTLVVASSKVRVPRLVGFQQRIAERLLSKMGLKVRFIDREATEGRDGQVLDQTPHPGKSVAPGDEVILVVRDNGCTPGYIPCLLFAPDYDCPGESGDGPAYTKGVVRVTGSDPYNLDPDNDGYGCE